MKETLPPAEEVLTENSEPEVRPGVLDVFFSKTKSKEKDPEKTANWRRLGRIIAELFGRRGETLEVPAPPEEAEVEVKIPHRAEAIAEAPPVPPPIFDLEEIARRAQRDAAEAQKNNSIKKPKTTAKSEAIEPQENDINWIEPRAVEVTIEHLPEAAESSGNDTEVEVDSAEVATEELPEELQNELRHEVKGEHTLRETTDEIATSVGQILEELKQKTALAHGAYSSRIPQSSQSSDRLAKTPLKHWPPLYQRSVIGGFGAAVFLLLAVAVFSTIN